MASALRGAEQMAPTAHGGHGENIKMLQVSLFPITAMRKIGSRLLNRMVPRQSMDL